MRKKVIEWISRESESTMSRLILSSVFFYTSRFWRWWLWRTPSIYVFTLFTVLIRKVNKGNSSKNSFSRKKYGVYIRPLLFSCTHMHKKVLLIKIDQTYWHKISITAVHLCTPFDPYYLVYFLSVVDHIKVEIVFPYFARVLEINGSF